MNILQFHILVVILQLFYSKLNVTAYYLHVFSVKKTNFAEDKNLSQFIVFYPIGVVFINYF